jgi:hypothetical protein
MMTRKDYINTAEILRDAIEFAKENSPENSQALYHSIEAITFVAEEFAEMFASDNKNFNEDLFFKAVHK